MTQQQCWSLCSLAVLAAAHGTPGLPLPCSPGGGVQQLHCACCCVLHHWPLECMRDSTGCAVQSVMQSHRTLEASLALLKASLVPQTASPVGDTQTWL